MRLVAGIEQRVPGRGIGLVAGTAAAGRNCSYVSILNMALLGSSLTLAVAGHMALLVVHVGSHREQVRHIDGCSLPADSPAAVGCSNPGLVAVAGSPAVGSRPVPSPVVEEGIGLGEGLADNLGCIDRRGQTWFLGEAVGCKRSWWLH